MCGAIGNVIVEARIITCITGTAKNIDTVVVQLDLYSLGTLASVDIYIAAAGGANVSGAKAISEDNRLRERLHQVSSDTSCWEGGRSAYASSTAGNGGSLAVRRLEDGPIGIESSLLSRVSATPSTSIRSAR